jgi:methionyl-tRNA synthetase
MPSTGENIWEQLNIEAKLKNASLDIEGKWGMLKPGTKIKKGNALFPRIETTKKS